MVVMIMMLVAMKRGMDAKRVELPQHFLYHCGCNTMLLLVLVLEWGREVGRPGLPGSTQGGLGGGAVLVVDVRGRAAFFYRA